MCLAPYFEVVVPLATPDPFFHPYQDVCLYPSVNHSVV